MKAALSFLFSIHFVFATKFSKTKVLQDSENITLDYEVKNGLFLFKLSAIGFKETQLGIVFSIEVIKN